MFHSKFEVSQTKSVDIMQTWNLSKILHRRIFRLKILHRQFHLILTVLVRKNTKNEWKWRNLHRWQKFYTAAGTDGTDKFHLCTIIFGEPEWLLQNLVKHTSIFSPKILRALFQPIHESHNLAKWLQPEQKRDFEFLFCFVGGSVGKRVKGIKATPDWLIYQSVYLCACIGVMPYSK